MMTHADIERHLRRQLRIGDAHVLAGQVVRRLSKSEWGIGDGAPTSLLVTVDRLAAAAARKLRDCSA
jgi:hypothetical protein